MKWIKDNTGRFPQRPFFEVGEIDQECEMLINSFLLSTIGSISYPITTNSLTILLEQKSGSLDLYSDLSIYGPDVEGLSEFYSNRKPSVFISKDLSEQAYRENRLRTTLTHELGHVHLHGFLLAGGQKKLFSANNEDAKHQCKRETILNANQTDWMEWQAGYASGAILMPYTAIKNLVNNYYSDNNLMVVSRIKSPEGSRLLKKVKDFFQVSEDAARVRLTKLSFLTEKEIPPHF